MSLKYSPFRRGLKHHRRCRVPADVNAYNIMFGPYIKFIKGVVKKEIKCDAYREFYRFLYHLHRVVYLLI